MASFGTPSFRRRGMSRPRLSKNTSSFTLSLPANRFNIFSDAVRIYGHNCFHQRTMSKARAMLYAHIHDDNQETQEATVRAVVDDAIEFARSVADEKPDIAIEVLYIASHMCEKHGVRSTDVLLDIICQHMEIFTSQMNFFRRRAWSMCIEERLWVRRYSLARYFSFLNVILPEISSGSGMDNLYPYIFQDGDDDAMIPFLSNFALTTKHLEALDFFLTYAQVEFEFKSSRDIGTVPLYNNSNEIFNWPFNRSRHIAPVGMDFGDPEEEQNMFDDFYSYSQMPGPSRVVPRDLEYRWRVVVHPRFSQDVSSPFTCHTPRDLGAYEDAPALGMPARLGVNHRTEALGRVRFVDYPIKTPLTYTTALGLACQASHPAAVKVLLQHGATPFFHSRKVRRNRVFQSLEEPFGIVVRILNRGRSWRNCHIETISEETLTKLIRWEEEEELRVVQIMRYMMRAVPSVPIHFFSDNDELSPNFVIDGAYKDPSTGTIVFQLHERFKEVVPECTAGAQLLMHLCRCVIRHCLLKNWVVKDGIKELPIPSILKRYLSLET